MRFDGIPVLLQIAYRVAHGMGVFTHEEGLLRVTLSLGDQAFDGRIHRTVDISR